MMVIQSSVGDSGEASSQSVASSSRGVLGLESRLLLLVLWCRRLWVPRLVPSVQDLPAAPIPACESDDRVGSAVERESHQYANIASLCMCRWVRGDEDDSVVEREGRDLTRYRGGHADV